MGEKRSIGVYLEEDTIDQLDEIKRERDMKQRDAASRTAVAADAIQLGLAALDVLEEEDPYKPIQPQTHIVRQALFDFYRERDE